MKDEALVKKVEGSYAEVLVQAKESCHNCSARALCSMNESGEATLRVLNPLAAQPGDWVEIEVPESDYTRQLILIFGSLLFLSVLGAGLGTIFSPILNLKANTAGPIGFFAGAGVAVLFVWFLFRQPKKRVLPVIRTILNQGGVHG